jgi:hypothetical protein
MLFLYCVMKNLEASSWYLRSIRYGLYAGFIPIYTFIAHYSLPLLQLHYFAAGASPWV